MNGPLTSPEPTRTLWQHFCRGWEKVCARRPFSFYLLFAILIVALLGIQVVKVRENPKQFALFLTLMFIFCFAVVVRAILDVIDIIRRHFTEHESVFGTTLGEKEFVSELGRRVAESKGEKPNGLTHRRQP